MNRYSDAFERELMIKKLSLNELIEAAASLDNPERAILIAAIAGQCDHQAGDQEALSNNELAKEWAAVASEGLAGAYGDNEPDYSEADLVP